MAKIKNAKNRNADQHKPKSAPKKLNPFEVHINKQKFKVLGQKTKNDRGLPGISREKAISKRKDTLLPEFNLRHKSNQFLDRRIGEKNKNMTAEDRIVARFTAERVKLHKKKSIFNLGDDEILTHKGQTLNEIEKFDDPRSEDEFSDDEDKKGNGRLDRDFVGEAHFGGGMLSNTGKEGVRSRKDLIEQLIIESKKRKAEKQKMREETIQLTEKLDSEWKDLIPLVNRKKKDDVDTTEELKKTSDDYDKMMRELKFEARGQPTDRLKTEDEIAKEEKEKLEQLEQDRLARMKGFVNDQDSKPKHRSADDLDDNFVIDSDMEEESGDLGGNLNGETVVDDDAEDDDEAEDESDNESGNDVETESEDDLSDLKASESESEESGEENEVIDKKEVQKMNGKKTINKNEESEVEDEEPETPIESKKVASGTENKAPKRKIETEETKQGKKSKKEQNDKKPSSDNKIASKPFHEMNINDKEVETTMDTSEVNKPTLEDKIRKDLLARKKIMEAARDELPYTFAVPETYDELDQLLSPKSVTYQTMIIERMIKCNHPSLSDQNKTKLTNLFAYLLQFINDLAVDVTTGADVKKCFQFIDHTMPLIYDLAQMNPSDTHISMMEILKEKQSNYRDKWKKYPGLDTLVFFKIISLLFPTSDFRHKVVTPAVVFMDQLLTRCKVKGRRDVGVGLFIVTLFLEYITLSKRFLPSVINFLRGVFHMAIPKTSVRAIPVIPPFKPFCSLLAMTEAKTKITDSMMKTDDLVETEIDSEFKIRSLHTAIQLCSKFYTTYEVLPSNIEIFDPIYYLMTQIPIDRYSKVVQTSFESLKTQIEHGKANKKLEYLVIAAAKPKALRLYEPNIQQVFENRKHRNISKERADHEKLLHKLKREKKGAMREIRRDNAFISNLKINKQIQSDIERKQKVKEILSGASVQQGELNALDRKRKKK